MKCKFVIRYERLCGYVWGAKKARREGVRREKNAAIYEIFYVFLPRDIYVVDSLGISYDVENVTIHKL